MNPLKCAFGRSSKEFLGFTIHGKGADLEPAKVEVIQDIESPTTSKQLKSFIGRGSYVCNLLTLAEFLEQFHKLLKKNVSF